MSIIGSRSFLAILLLNHDEHSIGGSFPFPCAILL
jgi:hypothetical protein